MPRGAQKQFDRIDALERAMQLFWEKGYEAAGLTELLERMGIGRQSLYNTFTDKRVLFLEAIEHYVGTRLSQVRGLLEAPGSPLRNIRRVLAFYEEHNTSGNELGCLLVNSLAEFGASHPDFGSPLRDQMESLETVFRDAFERAREAGELLDDASPRALARAVCAMACGVCTMGRAGMSKATVRDAIRMNAKLIDSVATDA